LTSADTRPPQPVTHPVTNVPWHEWFTATLAVGRALYRAENPLRPAGLAILFRNVTEALLFTLLGVATGGTAGGDYSFVGAVVLTTTIYTVAMVTDVPLRDRIDGTYGRLARASRPPVATFAVRALPIAGVAILATLITGVLVGAATGRLHLLAAMTPGFPLLLAGVASGSAVGLFVIAPAIGTRYDMLTFNTMDALIVVFSGALIPAGGHGALGTIGQVLPLTHAIAGMRSAMIGRPWVADLLAELAVGVGWAVLAVVTYRAMDRRGRRTGQGAFAQ
jgi:ABC-2 type transport system permease protein